MIFKCDCCNFVQDFADGEEAYQQGWDTEPHFHGYTTCDLCPASFQFLPDGWHHHDPIHAKWERDGRPAEYSQETCVAEEDRVAPEVLDVLKEMIKKLDPNLLEHIAQRYHETARQNTEAIHKELEA